MTSCLAFFALPLWIPGATSNIKHDWTPPAKYLHVFHHNGTQNQLQLFLPNILQKHYQVPILDILDMSGHSHQKQ